MQVLEEQWDYNSWVEEREEEEKGGERQTINKHQCPFRFYPLLSHLSFSKPLWIDWAIDDSMRST